MDSFLLGKKTPRNVRILRLLRPFTEMCERGEVGLLSLPEEVLIKIAQHLGKWLHLAQAGVADPHFLYLNLNPGFAESGSRICWIQIEAWLNPDSGFPESWLCKSKI
jgi:hypothetical protein